MLKDLLLVFIIFATIFVTGCGQMGPLYLPNDGHPDIERHDWSSY